MSDFMRKLKARIAEKEKKLEERLKNIMTRPQNARSNTPSPDTPNWIESGPVSSISRKKSSINRLLKGEVETKSSTKRT